MATLSIGTFSATTFSAAGSSAGFSCSMPSRLRTTDRRSRRGSCRLGYRANSVAVHQAQQAALHRLGQSRPFVDEAGVQLDDRGACADMLVGVLGARDSADADYREAAVGVAVDFTD